MLRSSLVFLVGTIWLLNVVLGVSLDCDFRQECCWRSAEGEGEWEMRQKITTNEFRRTFLVGKGTTPPDGPYVMRVETGAQEGGSSFMSCPFCSNSPVIVRFRHWQSPTAHVSLCWQLVVGQESQDEDQEECIQVSPNEQSSMVKQTLFVPVGKQIQLYFLIENSASKTYGVILLDRISVEFKDCKDTSTSLALPTRHTPTIAVHRSSSLSSSSDSKRTKHKSHHVPSQIDSGNRKLKINRLSLSESQLNDEVARQIRNLEHSVSQQDKDLLNDDGAVVEPTILSRTTSGRKTIKTVVTHSRGQVDKAPHRIQTLTSPINKAAKHLKAPQALHEAASRVTSMEAGSQRVAPTLPSTGSAPRPPVSNNRPPPPPPPPPQLGPMSLGKDFNPLHDLVGKEFSDFLDPSFVTKDAEDEADDPETEAFFREQKMKAPKKETPKVAKPSNQRLVLQPQRSIATRPPPQQPIPQIIPQVTQSPLHPLFKHPNECQTPGGCLFERGLCSWTHATMDPQQQFRLTKVGLSSFALANVRPSSLVVLETPTNFREEHLIVLDVLEHSADVSLRGCCQVAGQPQLYCPFATPNGATVMMWQSARFTCPPNTNKLVFMCENRGTVDAGECGIDNLRLHLPTDILLWEPCQKEQLSQL